MLLTCFSKINKKNDHFGYLCPLLISQKNKKISKTEHL